MWFAFNSLWFFGGKRWQQRQPIWKSHPTKGHTRKHRLFVFCQIKQKKNWTICYETYKRDSYWLLLLPLLLNEFISQITFGFVCLVYTQNTPTIKSNFTISHVHHYNRIYVAVKVSIFQIWYFGEQMLGGGTCQVRTTLNTLGIQKRRSNFCIVTDAVGLRLMLDVTGHQMNLEFAHILNHLPESRMRPKRARAFLECVVHPWHTTTVING